MKCKFCGSEIVGSPTVCDICGHELQYDEVRVSVPESHKKPAPQRVGKKPTKKPFISKRGKKIKIFGINLSFILLCIAVLAVIILVPTLIIVSLLGGEKIESRRMHEFFSKSSGTTSIVENGIVYEKNIEGRIVKSLSSSDGTVRVMLTEYGELYLAANGETTMISSGVKNYVVSSDGAKIAYLVKQAEETSSEESTTGEEKEKEKEKTTEEETTEYIPAGPEEFTKAELSLFIYNCADGESKHVENNVA